MQKSNGRTISERRLFVMSSLISEPALADAQARCHFGVAPELLCVATNLALGRAIGETPGCTAEAGRSTDVTPVTLDRTGVASGCVVLDTDLYVHEGTP